MKMHFRFWISQPSHRNSNLIKQGSFKPKGSNITYFIKQEFLVLRLDTQNLSLILLYFHWGMIWEYLNQCEICYFTKKYKKIVDIFKEIG